MRATDSLERTSFHEAGHAVAFHLLGLGVSHVTIEVDHVNWIAGSATPRRGADTPEDSAVLAVAQLAGPYATQRWNPERWDWAEGAQSDFDAMEQCIHRILGELPLHSHAVHRATLLTRARSAAEKLVADHWGAITRVAAALLSERTLDGNAVRLLCGRSN
jgi:hypothetical protein